MATNFLKFRSTSSDGLDLALGAGAAGFGFVAGFLCWDWAASRIYTWSVEGATGSGHLVAWVVAVGFIFKGIG